MSLNYRLSLRRGDIFDLQTQLRVVAPIETQPRTEENLRPFFMLNFATQKDFRLTILAIDHIQLAMPHSKEDEARAFYVDLLGFVEIPKPVQLTGRGGAWFSAGTVNLHLGVEADFRPAQKAHPAFLVDDLPALLERLEANGITITRDVVLGGFERAHILDPFGNRIELMEKS